MVRNYKGRWYLALPILIVNYLPSFTAYGAGPIAFDSWSESAGIITISCPLGFTCSEEISGTGMFQQLMTSAGGERYYQQIIADSGGRDGLMKLEAFVYSSNAGSTGLASKQYIEDNITDNNFNSTTYITTGWANQGEDSVDIHQFLDSRNPVQTSVYYEDEFKYFVKRDTNENNIGKYVDINQGQLDSTLLQGDQVTTGEDRYTFINRKAIGVYTSVAGSISLVDRYRSRGGGGGMRRGSMHSSASDGTISWSVGDELQAIWIGNRCDDCTSDSSRNRDFGFQSYENLTTGDGIAGQSSDSYLPQNWLDPMLGTSPVLINY